MPSRLSRSSTALFFCLALSGCLSSSDSTSEAGARPNSFPPLDGDFTETSPGDTNVCRSLKANEVCVTVEVPRALAGSAAMETRRNLYIVQPTSVEVVQVAGGLEEVRSVAISQRQSEQGSIIVRLDDLQSIPSDPDYVIRATLPGGTLIRGPLSDADQDVKLNPFSEYLVAVTLFGLGSDDIQDIKDCDASNNICLNQLVWPTLVDQIQDFEITIPDGMGLADSVSYLANRADLTDYVDDMVATLQISDGRTSEIEANVVSFNTVYFGLELNRRFLDDASQAGQWGVRRMTTGINEGNAGTAEIYPNLTLTSFNVLDLSVNSIAGQVPYQRQTLAHSNVDDFTGLDWRPNRHETAPGAAFIRDDLFLQTGRTVFQSVTQENGYLWGWAPNPYFFNSYIVPDSDNNPKGLLASYFHSGKALELGSPDDGKFERLGTLEDLAIGAMEINLKQLEAEQRDTPLDLGVFNSDYNEASFAVKLDEGAANPVAARVQTGDWENIGATSHSATFSEVVGTSAWVVYRNDDGTVDSLQTETLTDQITIENKVDEIYLNADNPKAEAYYGRLKISGSNQSGTGAALVAGGLLAYTYDDTVRGKGIKIVAKETNAAIAIDDYLLQGFMLGMTDAVNRLEQLNGSELTITSATSASLSLDRVRVTHILESDTVSDPQRPEGLATSGSVAQTGGNIEILFADEMLTFEGFVTQGGDVLVLTVRDGNDSSVGLVLGFRDY